MITVESIRKSLEYEIMNVIKQFYFLTYPMFLLIIVCHICMCMIYI